MQTNFPKIEDWVNAVLRGPIDSQAAYAGEVTYQAVYDLAERLGQWLQKEVPEKTAVMLLAEDRAVIMAALLAGMTAKRKLMLPNSLDEEALAQLKKVTGCNYAITDVARPLPGGIAAVAASDQPLLPFQPKPHHPIDLDDIWVQLFTGGSTAEPKILDKSIRNLMGEALYLKRAYYVTADDRIVATVPSCHIYGLLYAVLMPFVASACVFAGTPYYPNEIAHALQAHNSTIFISVPPHYRAVAGHDLQCNSLRLAFSSAGMLPEEDGQAFALKNNVPVVEIYGSTETGGIASRIRALGRNAFSPFECVEIKIENNYLWVRSDFLSPGLLERNEDFFKIGDRAESTTDGRFILLGRADGVVKVGGRRVDFEAVRQTLLNQQGVTDAVILSQPMNDSRETHMVAVVEGMVDMTILSKKIKDQLEPYARPRSIKSVEKMPFTHTGKYDRRALRALFDDLKMKS